MQYDKVKGLLGLLVRQGQAVFGQESCALAVRNRHLEAVLLDASSAENTQKRLDDVGRTYQTPIIRVPEGLIEQASGKNGRKVIGLRHAELAREILRIMKQDAQTEESGKSEDKAE